MSIFKQECQKTEPSIYQRGKTRSVIYFFIEKRGRIVYLVMLKKGGYSARTFVLCHENVALL